VKFKIDENLPSELAKTLRQANHDAETVMDEGLRGKADPIIAQSCRQEGRILVTPDRGFGDIRADPPQEYPGLIVLSVTRQDKPYLLDLVRRTVPLLDSQPVHNHLWIVEEGRVRIRGGTD